MTPPIIKKLMFITQSYGSKIKAVRVINLPPFSERILNIVKKFKKKKIADGQQIQHSVEDIYKKISSEYLPEELKETNDDSFANIIKNLLEIMQSKEWSGWFKNGLEKNEKVEDMLGMKGSFKKLDIE